MGQSHNFNQGADKTVSPYGSEDSKQISALYTALQSIRGSVTPAVVQPRGGKEHINREFIKAPFEDLHSFHQQLVDKCGQNFLRHAVAIGPEKANGQLEDVLNKAWELCEDQHHKPHRDLHLRRYALAFDYFQEGLKHALDTAGEDIDPVLADKVRNLTAQSFDQFNEDRARAQGGLDVEKIDHNLTFH